MSTDTGGPPCWWLIDWPQWVEQFEPKTDESYQQSAIAEHQSMDANGPRG
jgi:hypothetical protein